ncbi:unnamed protein product [Rhizoctonia solani]|uniref:Uncharacterized protein n=1 Tax=Rhizoctonia solani TaxID=456999 RepID=A0A8H2Y348_9AGAM|nr:unnamed protein product [Rhizoctonia solani]
MTVLQFVPGIRARSISYHRTAGKIINVLSIVSAISACCVARISFGGELSVQSSLYALGLMTAWAWTIRAWSYQVSVITLRFVMPLFMNIIFASGGFYTTMGCDEVANSLDNATMFIHDYPQCQPGWTGKPVTQVSVLAGRHDQLGIAAAARITFGTSMWISLCIHLIGTEYYLYKSKDESDRLHRVSNKLQNIRRNKASEGTVVTDYHLE